MLTVAWIAVPDRAHASVAEASSAAAREAFPTGARRYAQESVPDSLLPEESEFDSVGVGPYRAVGDSEIIVTQTLVKTPLKGAKPVETSTFDQPRFVALRSGLIPGWGQAVNGAWFKGALVASGEVGLALKLESDRNALNDLQRQIDAATAQGDAELEANLIDAYNSRLNSYTGRQWLFGAVLVYSMLDAYIDAHFRSFKAEFETDPALPGGVPANAKIGVRVWF